MRRESNEPDELRRVVDASPRLEKLAMVKPVAAYR